MAILFFIGLLLLLYIVANLSEASRKPVCESKHSWAIRFDNNDKKGYLICSKCGKLPGGE